MFCLDGRTVVCVNPKLSIGHRSKLYDYDNEHKYRQKPKKISKKLQEDSIEAIKTISFPWKNLSVTN